LRLDRRVDGTADGSVAVQPPPLTVPLVPPPPPEEFPVPPPEGRFDEVPLFVEGAGPE